EKFDVIILSDLLNDLWDVQTVLEWIAKLATPNTRIIINFYSRLWEPALRLTQWLGLAKPNLYQNWLTVEDVSSLLGLADCELIRHWEEILWPSPTWFLTSLCNKFLVRFWPIKHFALTNFIVARPRVSAAASTLPSVSVIVPARNEAGNIEDIFARTPKM